MIIEKDKVISVNYQLRLKDANAEVYEETTEKPFDFIFGTGMMLPKFEENLSGKKVGENFKFELQAADAYGVLSDDAIMDLPKDIFMQDGKLNTELIKVGATVPMQDKDGNRFNGTVLTIEDATIKMDFNHPLAGENLFFSGEILEVREASENEKETKHIHQEGCNSCGGH